MEIKASQVKELRDMTGVAMMDCKKALVESNGDIEKAVDLLRSNSALKAEKKSSRVAADGALVLSMGDGYASMVELNSETDFASKDANFLAFGEKVKNYISENKITELNLKLQTTSGQTKKGIENQIRGQKELIGTLQTVLDERKRIADDEA